MPLRFLPVVAVVVVAACGAPQPQSADADTTAPAPVVLSAATLQIARFDTARVTTAAWTEVVTAPARVALDPGNTQPIGSIVEGRVTKVYVLPGDPVRHNQVLVAIHSHELMDARAGLATAKAQLSAATAEQRVATSADARAERLLVLKALSQADRERASATREDADARVAAARAELARAEALVVHLVGQDALPADYDEHWVLIRSPMDGQVVARHTDAGNVVLVGAPLVTVSRTSTLLLIMRLAEQAAVRVRPGSTVRFTTPATGSETFVARITRVFPTVDTLTRTVEVHAAVTGAHATLRPEMYATAEIAGPPSAPTLSVPAAAVQSLEGDTVVVTAIARDGGLVIEPVPVRIGRLSRERAEILSGVGNGQLVITTGAAVAKAEILKRRGGAD